MEFDKKAFSTQANFHLAGLVPIAGQPLDFTLPYPDCLLPIAPNYTLIEAAIIECAFAGCDTIWVVCNDDTAPLVRHRVGDWIHDPIYFYYKQSQGKMNRRIPIFWVPIHPKDRDKRDCLSWSIIQGALSCLKISSHLSSWLIPEKYYVSFPYGVFDPRKLWDQRRLIKSSTNFYVTKDGKTMQDNYYTSFTFGKEEFVKYRRNIRKGTGRFTSKITDERGFPRHELPLEERWSARFFELKDVFIDLDLPDANLLKLDNFFNVGSWEQYIEFMSSEYVKTIKRPTGELFKYREFNRIGKDLE